MTRDTRTRNLFASVIALVSFSAIASLVFADWVESALNNHKNLAKVWLEFLKIFVAGAVACFGVVQWANEQRWKRRTAVLDRMKAFTDTPGAYNAQLMLQGRRVRVPLWDRAVSEYPYTIVGPEEVAAALTPERDSKWWPQNDRHDAIRNSFNDLLGRLADIDLYVTQARVLDRSDVRRISERLNADLTRLLNRAPETGLAVWCYMEKYGYQDVIAFAERGEEVVDNNQTSRLRTLVEKLQADLKKECDVAPTSSAEHPKP